jgi:hypothetical protein
MGKRVVSASLLSLLLAAPICLEGSARTWQTGRLVAVEISGQHSISKSGRSRRDIWWTYTLRTRDRTYVAVSREDPARIGVSVNNPVRLSVETDRIYLLDPQGKQHILRIIRQEKSTSSYVPGRE